MGVTNPMNLHGLKDDNYTSPRAILFQPSKAP